LRRLVLDLTSDRAATRRSDWDARSHRRRDRVSHLRRRYVPCDAEV